MLARDLSPLLAAIALCVALGAVLFLAAGPIAANDLWWHLAMGETYAIEGPWPAADPLLHTARPEAPIQHEWLFGVAAYAIEHAGGFAGLRVAHALAVLWIAWLAWSILRRETGRAELAALGCVAFLVLSWWRLMQERPDLASIPAALLAYRLLLAGPAAPSWPRVAGFAALMGVWANLHSLFAIGFGLALAALAGLSAEALLLRRPGATARARRVLAGVAAGFAASLLNPRGLEQHLTFLRSSGEGAIWRVSDEWRRFDPLHFEAAHESLGWLAWLLTDLVLLAFAAVCALQAWRLCRRREVDVVGLALGFAGVVALLASQRFLWLGFFPLLAVLRAVCGTQVPALGPLAATAALVLALALPSSAAYRVVAATLPREPTRYLETPYLSHKYAVPGVQFLIDTGVRGRLFNKYGAGGFLGYWLSPELRTFIDSRTEHYPPQVLDEYLRIVDRGPRGEDDIGALLDARGVDLFLGFGFPNDTPRHGLRFTGEHLRGHPDWLLVSRSLMHSVWLRRGPANAENLERIAGYYAERGVPFDRERGLDAAAAIDAAALGSLPPERRAIAYAVLGAYEPQLELERAALRAGADDPARLRRMVYALLRLGRVDEARRYERRLARRAPADPRSESVRLAVTRYQLWQMRARVDPQALPPAAALDRYPLLDAHEQQWLIDQFRNQRVTPR